MDFAAGMSPAGRFLYMTVAVQVVEPGIRIYLQHTVEVGKMGLRMDAFSVGAVREPYGRR